MSARYTAKRRYSITACASLKGSVFVLLLKVFWREGERRREVREEEKEEERRKDETEKKKKKNLPSPGTAENAMT
jgi:hypothetical protein